MPLSPTHQIAFYDGGIWVSKDARKNGTVYLRSIHDVSALNERQVLNAESNVYFSAGTDVSHIKALVDGCASRRRQQKVNVQKYVRSEADPDRFVLPGSAEAPSRTREALLLTEDNAIEPSQRITFFSRRLRPRFFEHPSAIGAMRDYAWFKIAEDFRSAVMNLDCGLGDLYEYAACHPLMIEVGAWKKRYWASGRASPPAQA